MLERLVRLWALLLTQHASGCYPTPRGARTVQLSPRFTALFQAFVRLPQSSFKRRLQQRFDHSSLSYPRPRVFATRLCTWFSVRPRCTTTCRFYGNQDQIRPTSAELPVGSVHHPKWNQAANPVIDFRGLDGAKSTACVTGVLIEGKTWGQSKAGR